MSQQVLPYRMTTGSETAQIQDAGHMMMLEKPDETLDALKRIL